MTMKFTSTFLCLSFLPLTISVLQIDFVKSFPKDKMVLQMESISDVFISELESLIKNGRKVKIVEKLLIKKSFENDVFVLVANSSQTPKILEKQLRLNPLILKDTTWLIQDTSGKHNNMFLNHISKHC